MNKMVANRRIFGAIAVALALAVHPGHAATIAYTDPANQGSQAFGGNLALNFDVVSPISVTDLGVFNASGSGTIAGTIEVVIYNTVTKTQVTPVVTFHGGYPPAGLGFDVFQAITPVVLGVGSYQVDAVGFSGSDLNGNLSAGSSSGPVLNSGGGELAFTGASYDSSASLDGPAGCVGCMPVPAQFSQFDAGTFEFQTAVAPVPEPGALGLVAMGLMGLMVLGTARHRRVA